MAISSPSPATPRRRCRAYSRPETSSTSSTAKRSRRRGWAVWRRSTPNATSRGSTRPSPSAGHPAGLRATLGRRGSYPRAVPNSSSTLIRPGERSGQVADVQARLRDAGFDVTDEPGHFGEATVRAVRAFQQRRGILVDGLVGPHTWAELVEAGWRLGDRALYLANPPMRGDDVLALQAHLNALGFDAGREDGIFGPDTDSAVRAFQAEYGVPEDGIFGSRTYGAVRGLRADRPRTAAPLREELWRTERGTIRGALVVVDAGHGGADRGTPGPNGASEADLCWDIADRVARRLAEAGARVRFSRTEAEGPELTERARRANALDGDLFVSIHLHVHEQGPAA